MSKNLNYVFECITKAPHDELKKDKLCISTINNFNNVIDLKFGVSSVILIYPKYVIRMIKKNHDKIIPDDIDKLILIPQKKIIHKSEFYNIYIEDYIKSLGKLNANDYQIIKKYIINMVNKGYMIFDTNYNNYIKNKQIYLVDYPSISKLCDKYDTLSIAFFVYNIYNLKRYCNDIKERIPYPFSATNLNSVIKYVNDHDNNIMDKFISAMTNFDKNSFIKLVTEY